MQTTVNLHATTFDVNFEAFAPEFPTSWETFRNK